MCDYDLTTEEGRRKFEDKCEWEGGFLEACFGGYGLWPEGDAKALELHRKAEKAIAEYQDYLGSLGLEI
jgi:hypothetical protein